MSGCEDEGMHRTSLSFQKDVTGRVGAKESKEQWKPRRSLGADGKIPEQISRKILQICRHKNHHGIRRPLSQSISCPGWKRKGYYQMRIPYELAALDPKPYCREPLLHCLLSSSQELQKWMGYFWKSKKQHILGQVKCRMF